MEYKNNRVNFRGFETFPECNLGKFDLVSTNVPFGDIPVYDAAYTKSDNAVRREAAKMIHRYYVLKGLDCLKDGGIEAYIITSNYLNNDTEQVQEALKQSRLIGAYRLANNLFKENGTTVGTDLLVLQKVVNKKELTSDECMLLTACEEENCPSNMYFTMYPEKVIATSKSVGTDAYGKPGLVYGHKDGVKGIAEQLGKVLAEDMKQNCDTGLFEKGAVKPSEKQQEKVADKKPRVSKKDKMLTKMHEVYTKLEKYEREKKQENPELRKKLNEVYDAFNAEYGLLHDTKNRKDVERVANELLALEYAKDFTIYKADIMLKPVAFATEEQKPMTAHEALSASLNKFGSVDMDYMQEISGIDHRELLGQLDGEVFWNPINSQFEIKAKFVSGNVVEKLGRYAIYV
jgi:hypothetical protein